MLATSSLTSWNPHWVPPKSSGWVIYCDFQWIGGENLHEAKCFPMKYRASLQFFTAVDVWWYNCCPSSGGSRCGGPEEWLRRPTPGSENRRLWGAILGGWKRQVTSRKKKNGNAMKNMEEDLVYQNDVIFIIWKKILSILFGVKMMW